jgi:hypothetical protein
MTSQPAFERTDDAVFAAIETEGGYSRPPGGSEAPQPDSSPSKMIIPFIPARMKKSGCHPGMRIPARHPRPFAEGTIHTCQREIRQRSSAPCRFRQDMIYVKRRCLPDAGKTTVFAAAQGALDDSLAQHRWHRHGSAFACLQLSTQLEDRKGGCHMDEALRLTLFGSC